MLIDLEASSSCTVAEPNDGPTNNYSPAMEREVAEIKKCYAELKAANAKLELRVQISAKELSTATESLREKEAQLGEIRLSLEECSKSKTKASNDLSATVLQLDKANAQIEGLG